jgi:hypothetical protein
LRRTTNDPIPALVLTVLPAYILKCFEIAACDDMHHRLLRCAWILGKRLRAAALCRASATKLRAATLIDPMLASIDRLAPDNPRVFQPAARLAA